MTRRHRALGIALALALCGCGRTSTTAGGEASGSAAEATPSALEAAQSALRRAVDDPERPAEDRARDADRHPFEVLRFFGIRPGMTVADLMAGRGYYTEILARAVGPEGRVIAQNNATVIARFAGEALSRRLARPALSGVLRLDRELEDLGLPRESLDAALMVLFYHDTVWMQTDRARMNREIFTALKPGGVFGVVDHCAEPGSGTRDAQTLHRIDPAVVKGEVLAAGFTLDAESDLLRHPEDDHRANVFEPSVRGRTDRFVYRFRRPR
jgi:predicted methyltransferase